MWSAKTSLDVMLEKNIEDYWNVDGEGELSDTWTSLPYCHKQSLVRKPSTTWSGRSTEDPQTILWRIWT